LTVSKKSHPLFLGGLSKQPMEIIPHGPALEQVGCGAGAKRLIGGRETSRREKRPAVKTACYTGAMMDELEFRRTAESALEALKRHLFEREEDEDAGFEVEEQNGVLNVLFENPPGKFVITPNAPVRQIWISALSTSFKLDWDAKLSTFVLPRTGEQMVPLVDRLIHERGEG
jgi:CyaY protein